MRSRLIQQGGVWRVLALERANGNCPFVADFDRLLSDRQRDDLRALIEKFADSREMRNREKFKKVADGIFAFKDFQVRVPCFMAPGHRLLLSHVFIKKGDAWPPKELQRARDLKRECWTPEP